MQLVRLSVSRAGQIIREIPFKEGLNLIIDAPTGEATQSGNNVGKTTVLRLIDYCLGSNGADIWEDPEFKKVNQEVYDFLHAGTPVTVTLVLKSSVDVERKLERRFVTQRVKSDAPFMVDDRALKNLKDYQTAVKEVLFGSPSAKPTLRQLMPKFIRSDSKKMSRTLRFLGDYTTDAVYEAIDLFLFGFFDVEVLESRPRLDSQYKKQSRDLQALTRNREEGELEQLLFHLRGEIEEIERETELRGEVPEIAEQANFISAIRGEATRVSGQLSSIQAEIFSVELALRDFKRDFEGVDAKVIESVYKEAESFIPDLHDKWKDLTGFVHELRRRKERFLDQQLKILEGQRSDLLGKIDKLEEAERSKVHALTDSSEFQSAIVMRADLLNKTKRLGSLEQDLEDIRSLKRNIANTLAQLADTQARIEDGKRLLQERLKIFNSFFSEYSKLLYGEQYLLHAEENTRETLVFKLSSVGANVGTGKKASQTAAFDFAYCNFIQRVGLPFPSFVCHDGLEAIHDNQLSSLLSTANSFGGQLIVATLRDKLPTISEDFIAKNTVLSLSQNEKLFNI